MRYVVRGLEIRTENAAKPIGRASRWVLKWIEGLPSNAVALDYGCGNLRYTVPLAERVRSVYAVDSEYQVRRVQKLGDSYSDLCLYAR